MIRHTVYIPPSLPDDVPGAVRKVEALQATTLENAALTAKIARMVAPFEQAERARRQPVAPRGYNRISLVRYP